MGSSCLDLAPGCCDSGRPGLGVWRTPRVTVMTVVVIVQPLNHVQLFVTPWTASQRLPCPSPSPGVCSNSCPLSQWCHQTISSSVTPFSSSSQSFTPPGSFPVSWLFTSGGQSIGASTSASVHWPLPNPESEDKILKSVLLKTGSAHKPLTKSNQIGFYSEYHY